MSTTAEHRLTVAPSMAEVDEAAWQKLAGDSPFVSHRFLSLLEATGCVGGQAGWTPSHLLLHRQQHGQEDLIAAAPGYLKSHSWGEFVFDQSWARAFAQHGLPYYPKLLIASPFTPVEGVRILAEDAAARNQLCQALGPVCEALGASSTHVLFADEQDIESLRRVGMSVRSSVQFHWQNQDYRDMEDFLSRLTHDKRKKIRQDSKYVANAGIRYQALEGDALTEDHLAFFYHCYLNTYRDHGSSPYLTEAFFQRAHAERILHFVLVLGSRGDTPVACALNVRSGDRLFGRYWGSTEFGRGLHFETCYTQSISYCIDQGLQVFEGGAQGEHKMSRGLEPVTTHSAHWVADRRFAAAIEDFVHHESEAVGAYLSELERATPFKR